MGRVQRCATHWEGAAVHQRLVLLWCGSGHQLIGVNDRESEASQPQMKSWESHSLLHGDAIDAYFAASGFAASKASPLGVAACPSHFLLSRPVGFRVKLFLSVLTGNNRQF
jgi:hypothetical protein